ncbi:MAG TPA: transglutaminaseTgpA domain-containing protein [Actinomycetota bacterium]|nr:transglutaminaseTgpA domain-containing protein [Actinomycetota bacterium]
MSDPRSLLERESRRFTQPDGAFERLVERRDRRRRNQRIAAGVVGIAVFVAAVSIVWGVGSPGRTETPAGPGGAGTDPFTSIQTQLATDEGAYNLFSVRASYPGYWRMYALDLFDGVSFTSSDPLAAEGGVEYTSPVELPQQAADEIPETRTRSYVFRIVRDMQGPWLPMPYGAEEVTLPDGGFTYDPLLNQAVVAGGLEEGFEYSVKAGEVPTAEELDAASAKFLTPEQYGVFTSLPDSIDPEIERIAEQWTAGEPTAYRKVLAIQQRFQVGFAYDSSVDPAESEGDLLEFLTTDKRGFCQQYATAMAVLVRTLGLPARIAVGYQPGTETPGPFGGPAVGNHAEDGTFLVKTSDAHAWVEVYFPDHGWLPFEPTPGRGLAPSTAQGTYLSPVVPTGGS